MQADHCHKDHADCVDEALAQAERRCRERGLRFTAIRRRVLELVWGGHRPIGAYDILQKLSTDGRSSAPPTVYRALDFLMDAGLVHRIDSLNAFIGCPDPDHAHSGQFLICERCQNVVEIDDEELGVLVAKKASEHGFGAASQMIEIVGLCKSCHAEAPVT